MTEIPVRTDWPSEIPFTVDSKLSLTDAEKLDYVYNIAVKAEKLMEEIAPQIGPMLQSIQNNPMLKMFMR